MKENIIESVGRYYTDKLTKFGPTPEGVDWNSKTSQYTRFEQILSIAKPSASFSILDFGCGCGELLNCINAHQYQCHYLGFDVSEAMLEEARKAHGKKPNVEFFGPNTREDVNVDYVVSSGVFNVKLDHPVKVWETYIYETLETHNKWSTKGFAFNMLTSYSDEDKKRANLYYGDPSFYFDYCKKKFSKNVALLHDYGLYEFTIRVVKEI